MTGVTVVGNPAATVITSSPRKILRSPKSGDVSAIKASRLAEDPLLTRKACLTPKKAANSRSNLSVYSPEVSQKSSALFTRFVISSAP